ncbi:MAG: hypothetical protein ACTIA6_07105 [Pseudoclavibacter sp.]
MQTRRKTQLSAAILGLAAVPLLAGCSEIIGACPAVGWTNTVDVQFTGPAETIASIETMEVCGAGTCWEAPRPLATPTTPPGATEAYEGPTIEVTDTRWTLPLDMDTPESLTITARSGDGTVLGSAESDVDWTRVGGTARCGGPEHAGIVDLALGP